MARKFLYVVAALIVLTIAAAFAYRLFGNQLLRWSTVPSESFQTQTATRAEEYRDAKMWLARPDLPGNPALWVPTGYEPGKPDQGVAVFFIHPTSYISKAHWNAPLDDPETNGRAELFLRGQASAFNGAGDIWAPRYRQATFGAFLTSMADAERALDLAYKDVDAALTAFLTDVDPNRPLILAGHSQGALHLSRLLTDRVAKDPALKRRIVAAYVVGWPISMTADLPAMGLPACMAPDQTGGACDHQLHASSHRPRPGECNQPLRYSAPVRLGEPSNAHPELAHHRSHARHVRQPPLDGTADGHRQRGVDRRRRA